MRANAGDGTDRHPPHRARPDTWLSGAAVLAWLLCFAVDAEGLVAALCFAAAGATTMLALLRPWCRQLAERSIKAATWAMERQRAGAESANARHAARWQAIVDTATEGIVTIDACGAIETVNDAALRLFGYEVRELLGRNVSCLMPEPFHSEHDRYMQHYLSTGERRIIGIGREVIGLRKNGSEFPIDLSVGEGAINDRRFFTGVIRDISERKDMQAKLAQTERLAAVGELAAGIAHEVNNPINTIINCAQLVADGDDYRSNSQIIIEEGQRIAEIVRDLLQFARDDRDRPQPTSIPEVVQRTLRLFGENLKRHGIALHQDVPDDLPQVHARPQQIQQVLLNLLINAKDALVQAGGDERRIDLWARADGEGVQFEVRDNGPGIPEHLGARVFEPFVTTKRARGGTGLGLSISKSIVLGYGGSITLDPSHRGGASFRVWLPVAPAE